MVYDLDSPVDRTGTNSIKWEFMNSMDPEARTGTLPFWVADMDFPCAQPVIEALHARVDRRIFGYSSNQTDEYHAAVCGWFRRRYGWKIPEGDVVFSPGVVPAINYLVAILTEPGDGVLIQTPVYYPFARAIRNNGRRVVENPLVNRDGRYEMDLEDLERKARASGARLLILCSPHNPVGRVWTRDELQSLGDVCERNGIVIVSDEIHCDLTRKGVAHKPLETVLPGYRDRIVTATAPSKTFNLAGMQLSNIVIHDKALRAKWNEYTERIGGMGPSPFAIVAAQAAYDSGSEWLTQVCDYLDGNAAFLAGFLAERLPASRYRAPEGTYLVWIDLGAYGPSSEAIVKRLVREAKVLFEAGTLFGAQAEGYVRVNIACPQSLLAEGFRRAADVLAP